MFDYIFALPLNQCISSPIASCHQLNYRTSRDGQAARPVWQQSPHLPCSTSGAKQTGVNLAIQGRSTQRIHNF